MNQARQADTGPDKPVSSVLDNYRNRIERYETADGGVHLKITLAPGSPLSEAQVERWYWQYVGTVQHTPEKAALYDGTPGSASLPRIQPADTKPF